MSEQTSQRFLTGDFEPSEDLGRLQTKAWIVGAIGVLGLLAGYFLHSDNPGQFYLPYLVAWLMLVCVSMGIFVISMLGNVTGGDWVVMIRPVSEASGRTLPFVFLAGLPVALGLPYLYDWVTANVTDPSLDTYDSLTAYKTYWLSTDPGSMFGGVYVRAVIYFVIWSFLAYRLSAISRRFNETGDPADRERLKKWSAGGMVIYVLTGTFASVDWIMAVDPHWFSSLYGFAWVGGQALAGFCICALAMTWLKDRQPFKRVVSKKLFHDYGKLMLAFTVLWAYFAFSQFLIIWSGNLPEEITWYLDRSQHGFKELSVFVVLGHFVIPFAILLSANLKKKPKMLAGVAVWILAMRWLDFYWMIVPSHHHHFKGGHVWPGWLDLAALLALLGLWAALTIGQFKGRKALPVHEPLFKELTSHG